MNMEFSLICFRLSDCQQIGLNFPTEVQLWHLISKKSEVLEDYFHFSSVTPDLIQKRYTRINKNRVYKMSKEKFHRRRYDLLFKLSVLKDYYESGCSEYSISKKYDLKGTSSLRRWIETFPLDDKSLSLCEKLKEKIIQSRHMKEKARASKQLTEKEKLQEEILLLRKALQYSELRNEALNEMIRIAKEEDGYDVLKKRGAKQL